MDAQDASGETRCVRCSPPLAIGGARRGVLGPPRELVAAQLEGVGQGGARGAAVAYTEEEVMGPTSTRNSFRRWGRSALASTVGVRAGYCGDQETEQWQEFYDGTHRVRSSQIGGGRIWIPR